MWERLKNFIKEMEAIDFSTLTSDEKTKVKERLLREISFFQHERLVHLIVTVMVAILSMLNLIIIKIDGSIATILLELLFIGLLIPYIIHYYRLENGVQKLYTINDKLN